MEINFILNAGISAVLSAMLALTGCSGKTASNSSGTSEAASAETTESAADTEENNMTSLEVIRAMGNGINLGNTLEAYNHQAYINGSSATSGEIVWGQPRTTQEMIQGMKAAGFDTIRIPIAWTNGMYFESGDYTIDSALMDRVDEVVTWALDADMYVIINDHWDGSWWGMFGSAEQETRDKAMEMYKAMWTQIGERFADRSYKLIFESANEELGDRLNDKEITGSRGVLSEKECYETHQRDKQRIRKADTLPRRQERRPLPAYRGLQHRYHQDLRRSLPDAGGHSGQQAASFRALLHSLGLLRHRWR